MPPLQLAELAALIATALAQGVFPGAVYGLSCGPPAARQTVIQAAGRLFAPGWQPPDNPPMQAAVLFDLASLTKPLATALGILCLKHRGLLHLNERLPDLLGQTVPADKRAITLAQLLRHCSGLPAHRPYFERLRLMPPAARQEAMLAMILAEPLESSPGTKAVYSDLGYLLLGRILTERSHEALDEFAARWLYAPLGLDGQLVFRAARRPPPPEARRFAPTEDCAWRGRLLQGEVHDDNTHVLGGVAGQAGLFGTAGAVLTLTRFLLDLVKGRVEHPHLAAADLRAAVCRAEEPPGSTWGLGFDSPALTDSSAGHLLSRASFGHLGFTGTSFWCDPERDMSVVLLSNRVHPCRANTAIRQFRPRFHDAVARCCDQSGATACMAPGP